MTPRGDARGAAAPLLGFSEHLEHPQGLGVSPAGGSKGVAGGSLCGDLVTVTLAIEGDRVAAAGFDASGCGAAVAAGSAVVTLVEGRPLLEAARVSSETVSAELGGLSPGKLHAADLAADALHQALGAAARAHAALAPSPGRTLVAMSGGVDSAVAALLVARAGREAVAVTLELWRDPDNDAEASCCSASAVRAARSVAHELGLPHFTLDLREEFRAGVVQPFLDDHRAGLTPNPCVRCNGGVRLDAMVAFADRLGAAELATGHYARKADDGRLRAAADANKDQAYMLAATREATRGRLRFPLGDLTKPQVRAIATEAGLRVAAKKESQDLCFLAGTGKAAFLAKHGGLAAASGPILDGDGRRIGSHEGHHHFTVGQRRGIGVAAAEPLYVLATDAASNSVTVGPREALRADRIRVRDAHLAQGGEGVDSVRLRYRARPLPCRVVGEAPTVDVELHEPVEGAAPGQVAVFLRGDVVAGHGIIA